MADKHNVFISYKYSDAVNTRDKIIEVLGDRGHIYKGEKGYNPLNVADETLKDYLSNMIFNTTVTIVIISPCVIYSDWVEWEVRYSLRQTSRDGRQSKRNGIVCVIQGKDNYRVSMVGYDLIKYKDYRWAYKNDYANRAVLKRDILPKAIIDNMQTSFPPFNMILSNYLRQNYKLLPDYCVVVDEEDFIKEPDTYVNEAYRRAHDSEYEVKVNE